MTYKYTFVFALFFITSFSFGQTRIDNNIPFQSDPAKQYSIFIPSSYDASVPNKLMLGLHPFNTNRWNSISWCDTLIAFAEANNLLMICPDGGSDGKVDDPIDTAFTTAMLDSMLQWYNVDESKIFAMGFSWGARTTYTYGLNHIDRFAGFLPIGAAINGTNEVNGVIQNAAFKPYYLVHGNNDNPNTRFYPVRNALIDNEACIESNLMPGVGHTIDFPNRNQILTDAFLWIDSVSCEIVGLKEIDYSAQINLFPNPLKQGEKLNIELPQDFPQIAKVSITGIDGKILKSSKSIELLDTQDLKKGLYILELQADNQQYVKKFIVE